MAENYPDIIIDDIDVQQNYSDTCAIKSQQLIMYEFGINVSEEQCMEYSREHGWYGQGWGTQIEDVGKLLEAAGIPCSQYKEANIFDLANELQQGHKVIVAVDSGELWQGGSENEIFEDLYQGEKPDHALIVSGIDVSDPENPMVIITDPGTGEAAHQYPLDMFMDAWSDSQCFMVSTDVPSHETVEQFTAAGYTNGHLPEIAGVEYSVFEDFVNYSHQIDFDTQFSDLYSQFDIYPEMEEWNSFDDVLSYNEDIFTVPYVIPEGNLDGEVEIMVDPFADYDLSIPDPFIVADVDYSAEMLEEYYDDAMVHYHDCMDNGMYLNASIWESYANDIQAYIDGYDVG